MSRRPVDQPPQGMGRRRFLRMATLALGGVAAAGLGSRQAAAQQSKQAVAYQDSPNGGQRCGDCQFFNASRRSCQVVAGEISPNGWCRLYRRGSLGGY
jgi:hypothetical protein